MVRSFSSLLFKNPFCFQSPTSLKLTFEQLKRGKKLDLKDCLIMEYRIGQNVMNGHDFFEGVRSGKYLFY
jgi:enoyl-CoA hydratase/carnithine racemase